MAGLWSAGAARSPVRTVSTPSTVCRASVIRDLRPCRRRVPAGPDSSKPRQPVQGGT